MCVEDLVEKQNKATLVKVTEQVCVEDLVEKQNKTTLFGVCVEDFSLKQTYDKLSNKTTLFKVTEPSSLPYRTPSACSKRAAYPDPPPVILIPGTLSNSTQIIFVCVLLLQDLLQSCSGTVRNQVL